MQKLETSLLEENYVFQNIHRFRHDSIYNFNNSLLKLEFFIMPLFFSEQCKSDFIFK